MTSLTKVALSVFAALLFGSGVWYHMGAQSGMEWFTGYALEMSLSLDNVFVMSLIMTALAVPPELRSRVLTWGIMGAIVLRAIFIGLGAAIVSSFSWVLLIFGAFLLWTGVKMMFVDDEKEFSLDNSKVYQWLKKSGRMTKGYCGNSFFVKSIKMETMFKYRDEKVLSHYYWTFTPLFVAVVLIEIADIVFAVDSVPAIFAVTQNTFIVYTSNIFAILCLRSLYFVLEDAMERFKYLGKALSMVLVFIGAKILYEHLLAGKEIAIEWASITTLPHMPTALSLGIVLTLLLGGVAVSMFKTKGAK